jgi:hypothetical protein
MKKSITIIAFLVASIVANAQEAKIIKGVNEAGDVASFELDCTKKFPALAKGLRYNITRHEFKGAELKNNYHIMLVMDGFYSTTLNNEMTISAVFSDGTIVDKRETIESHGYFNGACTLTIKNPDGLLKLDLKQVIVHADKDVIYIISAQDNNTFKKNLSNIVTAK